MAEEQAGTEVRGRIWRFGDFEFAEIPRTLKKKGQFVEIGGKPLDVLKCLLEARTRNVTREELLKQVWLGEFIEPSIVKVTVSTLRRILGDQEQTLILTVFKVGYRMGIPVSCVEIDELVVPRFVLADGVAVPNKPMWHLRYPLDQTKTHWVWVARHDVNSLARVFKFAEDGVRYSALQREITLSRLFARVSPKSNCFVKVFDWRLDASPYYLESEFGGINLLEWAEKLRNSDTDGLPRKVCLQVVAEICDAIDIAHEVGVFHNDLKPSNILLTQAGPEGSWHIKVADFGIATLLEPRRLAELDITNHGFDDASVSNAAGSALYRDPAIRPGQPSTRSADIYSIGVILYQLLCGDFTKTPTPGWETGIEDAILRADIEEAVEQNLPRRIKSAAELALRLRSVEARAMEERARADREQRSQAALRQVQKSRARRPFLIATFATLLLGLCASGWFYRRAVRERETASEINNFLTEDLLRQGNPNAGKGADETLRQAIEDAIPQIDLRFKDKPDVAAGVHYTIAHSLDNAMAYDSAGKEYDRAASNWIRAQGPLSQDAIFAQLQHAFLDARSGRVGSVAKAKSLQAAEGSLLKQIRKPEPRLIFANLDAEAMIELASGDPRAAEANFQKAVDVAVSSPSISREVRLTAQQRLCSVQLRVGYAMKAESCFRQLRADIVSTEGSDDGNIIVFDFGIAQALLFQGKYEEAIHQVDVANPFVMKQLGPKNIMVAQLIGIRAAAEGQLERWDASIRDDAAILAIAKETDPTGFMAVGALSDMSLAECRSGQYESGEKHARDDLRTISAPGQDPGMKGVVEYSLASCLLLPQLDGAANPAHSAESERLLNDINVPLSSATSADPGWGANVDLARAQLAVSRHQYEQASMFLAKAKPSFDSPSADPYQRQAAAILATKLKKLSPR